MITPQAPAGPRNSLTDVAGLRVGHHTARGSGFLTGTTVVVAPDGGMVAGVDVRGGAPGTHETDLLRPTATVPRIDAVVLTGGSAFGLAACAGVMDALADRAAGVWVGPGASDVVPIVPAAVVFDLGRGGDMRARPDADFGRRAIEDAWRHAPDTPDESGVRHTREGGSEPGLGCVGAGTGTICAGLKGGVGTASAVLDGGATVGALAVVNAAGSAVDPVTGGLLGARLLVPADLPGGLTALPDPDAAARERLRRIVSVAPPPEIFGLGRRPPVSNTTLVVVATDASLTKVECTQLAAMAQNGLPRALEPVHTAIDGDVVFAAATGRRDAPGGAELHQICVAGAAVVTRAIVRALLFACGDCAPDRRWPSWLDVVTEPGG